MNILLVDDEKYVLDAIMQRVDWNACRIDEIFTANNIRQAKSMLESQAVQVIVCDIVMPQGTGFELLDWVRQQKYQIQVIFLTSYADFSYAKKAISLDCVDYLLKPINYQKLTDTIQKAVAKVQELYTYEKYKTDSLKWKKKSDNHVREEFISSIIHYKQDSEIEIVMEAIKNLNLNYSEEDIFYPVILHLFSEQEEPLSLNKNHLEFLLGNIVQEMILESGYEMDAVVRLEGLKFAVILRTDRSQSVLGGTRLLEILQQMPDWVNQHLKLDIWCGIGESCDIFHLPKAVETMQGIREENLNVWNTVTMMHQLARCAINYQNDNLRMWQSLLEEGRPGELVTSMHQFLSELEDRKMISREILKNYRIDVMQLLYAFLSQREIKAHLLFGDKQSEALHKICLEGMKGARIFTEHYVKKTLEHMEFASKSNSVAEIICDYLDNHYQKDVSRDDLVKILYLNPDYISRSFKKETGMSIRTYLIQKRIQVAKELLQNSEMPIHAVSMHAGYGNFSYFTKLFRENVGCSPIEYRKQYRITTGEA